MNEQTLHHAPPGWRAAWHYSWPVAMGYLPAGIAFGVLMSAAGLPAWLALLLSVTVYAGAAQYAAIPMLAGGAGVLALAVNTAVINLRHVFYGLPLLRYLPAARWRRLYCLFALTDESFSVLTTLPEPFRQPLFAKILFLNHSYWVVATGIGVLLGAGLSELIPHLDFALACLFVILWYEQFRAKQVWWPSLLAVAAFALAKWLSVNYVLLLAVGCCAVVIVLAAGWPRGRRR